MSAKPERRTAGALPLPGIQTPGGGQGGSFFLTDLKDSSAMPGGASRTQALTSQFNLSMRQSPSRQNLETLQAPAVFESARDFSYDEMLNAERRKARSQHMRTKQILLMHQIDHKQRNQLENRINKKIKKAEKKFDEEEKMRK